MDNLLSLLLSFINEKVKKICLDYIAMKLARIHKGALELMQKTRGNKVNLDIYGIKSRELEKDRNDMDHTAK